MTAPALAEDPLVGPAAETATQWPSLSAFGKPPEWLAHDNKSDLGSTAGNVQIDRWQKNGEQADQLAVILDSLISARRSYASKDRRSHDGRYPLSRETATTGGFDLEADDDLAF